MPQVIRNKTQNKMKINSFVARSATKLYYVANQFINLVRLRIDTDMGGLHLIETALYRATT